MPKSKGKAADEAKEAEQPNFQLDLNLKRISLTRFKGEVRVDLRTLFKNKGELAFTPKGLTFLL